MKRNVKIIIRRGMLCKIQGPPKKVILCALAVVVAAWMNNKEKDAMPEELVQHVDAVLWDLLGRLGYTRRERQDEAEATPSL